MGFNNSQWFYREGDGTALINSINLSYQISRFDSKRQYLYHQCLFMIRKTKLHM